MSPDRVDYIFGVQGIGEPCLPRGRLAEGFRPFWIAPPFAGGKESLAQATNIRIGRKSRQSVRQSFEIGAKRPIELVFGCQCAVGPRRDVYLAQSAHI